MMGLRQVFTILTDIMFSHPSFICVNHLIINYPFKIITTCDGDTIMIVIMVFRHDNSTSINNSHVGRRRSGVCSICLKGPSILPNPEDGPDGQKGWNLEIIGNSSLCTSTGIDYNRLHRIPWFNLFILFSLFSGKRC